MYQTQNPFTQIVEKKYRNFSDIKLRSILDDSYEAFHGWKLQNFQCRSSILLKVAELLEERKNEYGRLITIEMGKPISQSVAEVEKCALVCRYYAANALDFLKSRRVESTAKMSQINYEPLGAVFAIMPWNFPFWQVFRFIAPTLMAGNVGLLKHASNVPQCAMAIAEVLKDAGVPNGVWNNLFITHKQVEFVIAHKYVKAVTLTGSNIAGSRVAELAGKYTKKTVLELGGSDPFIVFEDADMNHTLEQAVLSRFLNAGQSCIAAKRFIVHQNIAKEFISRFKTLIENLSLGNPLDKETFVGPIVNLKALNELQQQVDDSINMGAVCITGGSKNSELENIFNPTLLINAPNNSPIWAEETFGPVAGLKTFDTDEEAVRLANDTRFGLGASIWTQDMDRAMWACKNINSGTVAVNGMVKSEPGLPFGGINESGYGRELGDYGIYEFVNIKTVSYFG